MSEQRTEIPTRQEIWLSRLAFPVYAWQGLRVRTRTQRLRPPSHDGWLRAPGSGAEIGCLVIGDSSAAGVGVERIEESFAGHLLSELSGHTGRPVAIRIAGMNSATSADIRDYVVPHLEPRDFRYVLLNLGTNDAKNYHSARRFRAEFGTLLYALKARFPAATLIWSGIIDLASVPTLPQPLAGILGVRSRRLNQIGRLLCAERGALAPVSDWRPLQENFAEDGFHASRAGYAEWAGSIARMIAGMEAETAADDQGRMDSPAPAPYPSRVG